MFAYVRFAATLILAWRLALPGTNVHCLAVARKLAQKAKPEHPQLGSACKPKP